jgi:S-adenosylmethionine decarboxylase
VIAAGVEWVVDSYGCDPTVLRSQERLAALLAHVISELRLSTVAEPIWHVFADPGGITGLVLLSESHLTIHTFPETGFAALNYYSCRAAQTPWRWDTVLAESLGAARVKVRAVQRGE